MKKTGLRVFFTVLLIVSVAGWILYMPPAALDPDRAVPAHAHIVYQNDSPDWFLSFFQPLEKTVSASGKTGTDSSRHWKNILRELAKHPLTVATVPLRGRDRRDSWIAVSALGPRAIALRWRLRLFPPEGIQPAHGHAAWPVWTLDDPSLPSWARVRFSVTDSLLICSVSDDSRDIYRVLDTLDGRRLSRRAVQQHQN